MTKHNRPSHFIAACVFLCAMFVACVMQVSAGNTRALVADVALQVSAVAVQAADTGNSQDAPTTDMAKQVVDASVELPELLASEPALQQWPAMISNGPPGFGLHALPHPFLETPQRPPRA